VRNGERFLPEAIESVLAEGDAIREAIVVDDGSTDGTARSARRHGPPVRVLSGRFGSAAAARNAGIAASVGERLAFLDHDDLWTPGRIARQLAVLDAEPGVDVVLGLTQRVRLEADRWVPVSEPAPEPSLGAGLFTRRAFDRVGLLDVARRYDEDVDWYVRAREAGIRTRVLPELVQVYRRHETNATNRRAEDVRAFFAVLKDSIARRRGSDGNVRAIEEAPREAP
jgi:glycosyltransferase involved in cell wall biosynthesis